jgi:5-methylcytosine-specific restriction endonuclease McrA
VVLQLDHVVPVAAGGAASEDNLVAACADCNLGKSKRMLA